MQDWQPGWKVIRKASQLSYGSRSPRYYYVGQETFPRTTDGPLACFATEFAAEEFLRQWAAGFCRRFLIVPVALVASKHMALWVSSENGTQIRNPILPPGTILADAVYRFE